MQVPKGDTSNPTELAKESEVARSLVGYGSADAVKNAANRVLNKVAPTKTIPFVMSKFASFGTQIDNECLEILDQMSSPPKGSTTSQILEFVEKGFRDKTSPAAIVRSDHTKLIEDLINASFSPDMEDETRAEYRRVDTTKGIILINRKKFELQPNGRPLYDPLDFRGTLAHEIQHARNIDEELLISSWEINNVFFVDVPLAESMKNNKYNAWTTAQSFCGELAGRFVGWYVLQELYSPAQGGLVKLPSPAVFFARAVQIVESYAGKSYDKSKYLEELKKKDAAENGGKGTRVARQTAIWMQNVADRYHLFDSKLYAAPEIRGKDLFLSAVKEFNNQLAANSDAWRTATDPQNFDPKRGLLSY